MVHFHLMHHLLQLFFCLWHPSHLSTCSIVSLMCHYFPLCKLIICQFPLTNSISKYFISHSLFCLNYSSSILPCPLASFLILRYLKISAHSFFIPFHSSYTPQSSLFKNTSIYSSLLPFLSAALHASLFLKLSPFLSSLSSPSLFHCLLSVRVPFSTSSFLHPLPWQCPLHPTPPPTWQRA